MTPIFIVILLTGLGWIVSNLVLHRQALKRETVEVHHRPDTFDR